MVECLRPNSLFYFPKLSLTTFKPKVLVLIIASNTVVFVLFCFLLFCLFCFFETGLLCRFGACPGTHSVDQIGLKLIGIHLPLPPQC